MLATRSNHIVFTTIYRADVLLNLHENLERNGNLDNTICWVIGDNRTPVECKQICDQATRKGLETRYLDIAYQDAWGKKFPEFYGMIPYNNETRRNIGFLHALEHDCETMISIDDDNFPTTDDFIGFHAITGKQWHGELIKETSGYYNICEFLTIEPHRPVYPRGFPFNRRGGLNKSTYIAGQSDIIVGVNSGLWTCEPDIDATTWLNGPVQSHGYTGPPSFVLDHETWSPINTQNTSLVRELVPAYLCIPMGHSVPGGRIERYGDIWSGYFLQAVMGGTPFHACFGRPIVEHRRNPHNYLDDLRHEYWGMMLTDWLLSELRKNFMPTGNAIIDRVVQLSEFILSLTGDRIPDWTPPEVEKFIENTGRTLSLWAMACKRITG